MEYAEARGYGRPLRVAYLVIDSVWKHELVFRGQRTFAALDETRPATDARHVARYATKGILPSYTTTQASMKPPCAPVATTSRSCHRAAKQTCPFDTPDRSSTHFWLLGPTLICRDLRRDRCPVRGRCHRLGDPAYWFRFRAVIGPLSVVNRHTSARSRIYRRRVVRIRGPESRRTPSELAQLRSRRMLAQLL
jgi:hypothetical protein